MVFNLCSELNRLLEDKMEHVMRLCSKFSRLLEEKMEHVLRLCSMDSIGKL